MTDGISAAPKTRNDLLCTGHTFVASSLAHPQNGDSTGLRGRLRKATLMRPLPLQGRPDPPAVNNFVEFIALEVVGHWKFRRVI
jgi:hypothetical protein